MALNAKEKKYDVIVVGSGAAGLQTALHLKPLRVLLVTKSDSLISGSTAYAQGGMAAAIGHDDTPDKHSDDTIMAGAGLVYKKAADTLTQGADDAMKALADINMPFDRDTDGTLILAKEAAHSARRILHAGGDATGKNLSETLAHAVLQSDHITVMTHTIVWDLTHNDDGVTGIRAYHPEEGWQIINAPHIVLATGGTGQLYAHTTNPCSATGDGLALAYRAGAELSDIEFVQFHPTALAVKTDDGRKPLLTEALRGEGAFLYNEKGERFMCGEHPDAELAPRDVVARAVWRENAKPNGAVYLDARHAVGEAFVQKFPTVFALCQKHGLDPRRDLLPVAPAAHYHMGGVRTDLDGRTSINGLWAVGECARTGVHGANRLASNSLLECLVFAKRLSDALKDTKRICGESDFESETVTVRGDECPERLDFYPLRATLKDAAYRGLGLVRDEKGMKQFLKEIADLNQAYEMGYHDAETVSDHAAIQNLLLMARLMTEQALLRKESRGGHYRTDFPRRETAYRYSFICHKDTLTEHTLSQPLVMTAE